MLEFMTQNPWRVPDWRCLRAKDAAHGGPPATVRLDGATSTTLIRRAARFYKALQGCGSDDRRLMKLAEQIPIVFWAYHLYDQPHNPMRWSIEARILAGESDLEIASRIGCGDEIIQTYEALFFNVREKLNCTDYISTVVLKDTVTRDIHERDKDLLWKLVAYTGGSHLLDAVMHPLVNRHWVASPDDIPAFLQDVAINVIKKKATIAALTVPINGQTEMKLIKVLGKFVKIERSADSQGRATDQIVNGISAMLNILPFRVGSTKAAKAQAGPLSEYEQASVELCQGEMMCVAAGHSLPGQELFKQLKFP